MSTNAVIPTSIVLREVTLLYPSLFEKKAIRGSDADPRYSTVILLPPGFDMTHIRSAILAAATNKFGKEAIELLRSNRVKLPLHPQAEKAAEGKGGYSDEAGAQYFNAASDNQPGVVDQRRQPVIDPDKVYGGVVVNIQVNAFAWQNPLSGRGVSFGLQNIQIVRDGPRIGNSNPDPTKVFDDLDIPPADPKKGPDDDADLKSLFG